MQDALEDLCRKHELKYGRVYDFYLFVEYRVITQEKGVLGYFFSSKYLYHERVIGLMDRYYRRKNRVNSSRSEQ